MPRRYLTCPSPACDEGELARLSDSKTRKNLNGNLVYECINCNRDYELVNNQLKQMPKPAKP